VILAGTNNIDADSPADIAAGVHALVAKTRELYPEAKIILVSITPRGDYAQKVQSVDDLIQHFADQKNVFYFDLASYMVPEGDNWKGLGDDRLHYSPDGYTLWASHMEPLLYRLTNTPSVKPSDLLAPQPPLAIPADGPKLKIACVGDSITAGVGASGRDANYPSLLGDFLGPRVDVSNFGESGATLLKNGNSPYWQRPSYASSAQYAPNVVIMMLGTNDSKPVNWATHSGEFGRDAAALLEYYKNLPTHPRLFVCTPPPVAGSAYDIAEGPVEQEMPILRQVAAQEGATVIDVHDLMPDDLTYFVDGVHPDNAGYVQLASAVYWGLTHKPAILMTDDSGGRSSGAFVQDGEVTVAPTPLGVDIRITANKASLPSYTGPIEIHGKTVVDALAYADGKRFGDPADAQFDVAKPLPALSTRPTLPGLVYRYYEGNLAQLSDLDTLTPKATGVIGTFDLTPHKTETNFGFIYDGYINIPIAGVYTFGTDSDDGSSLLLDGQAVVDNDGVHGPDTVTGSVVLAAGLHKIEVRYFQGTGGYQLQATWQGPTQTVQEIPVPALSH